MQNSSDGRGRAKIKKTKKKVDKKRIVPLRVLFADYVNSTEVAAILIDKLERFFVSAPELAFQFANGEALNPIKFGEDISMLFDSTEIQELMNTEVGQGIMLGMFLSNAMHAHAATLEEEEDHTNV